MTIKTTKNDISKNNRDEAIGRALAATIAELEVPGSCLADENMAAIIDGSLSDTERDLFMKHLSSCEACFKVFSMSHALMSEKAIPSQRNRFILPSAGLAIAALLAIFLRISFQSTIPDTQVSVIENKPAVTNTQKQAKIELPTAPPALNGDGVTTVKSATLAAEAARLLLRGSDVKLLLAAVSSDRSEVFGFSGAVTREKRAFRLGIQAADLELLLQTNEREEVVAHLKKIIELMPITNQEKSNAAGFEKIISDIEKGVPLKNYRNCTASIEKAVVVKDELLLYRFGVWAEGGRLAAIMGNKGYFEARPLHTVVEGIKDKQLPPGLVKSLQDVEGIVAKGTFTENDFLVMKRALEDVTAIF